MTIVAYGYGISPGGGFLPGPSVPPVTPNNQIVSRYVSVRIRQTIYKLKRLYGGSIFLYRQGTPITDVETGVKTWTGRSVITISRAIILPVKIERNQTQSISMISMDKQFVYGGSYDRGARWFYIDPRDLPQGYVINQDDWIVYKGLDGVARKYEIKAAKDNEFDTLWEILGTELIGVVPEQIHNLSGYSILGMQQNSSVSLTHPVLEMQWKTDNAGTSASNQITLPLVASGSYNFTVDWGDGTKDKITAWDDVETTHTYATAGTYDVSIIGPIRGFVFNNGGDRLKLLSISKWGQLDLNSEIGSFYGCANLTSTATDAPTVGTTLRNCFRDCTAFNGQINNWDVSAVTNFNNCFTNCANFNQPLSSWNTSSATTMIGVLQNCTSFDQSIDNWDVSGVLDFTDFLRNCTIYNQSMSSWDVSSASDFTNMLRDCPAFNANISGWTTSSATLMTSMFANSTSFDQNIGGWDVSGVTDMTTMFFGVTLSTANYDSLLIGWAGQTLQSGVSFHGGSSKYTGGGAAEAARNDLLDAPELWTIVDGGIAP